MELFKHQKEFLAENPNKTSLVWSCGTGKSRAALLWAGEKNSMPLIICPKALKTNWWRESQKAGVTVDILTKEEFRKKVKTLKSYKQVIVDEVHNGFLTPNFKSQMSKALKWYLKHHNVPRVLLLSATVYTSSPWNIYNLAHYTGHDWNWYTFKQAFFFDVRMGPRMIPMVKKGSEVKLAEITKRIASVVDIHDCMDVPLQYHAEPEYFSLNKEQVKAIKDNYDPTPIVRYTLQHEIENGVLLSNEYRPAQSFAYDKLERIKELIEENPKVAIVCRYNAQIDALKREIPQALVIRGDVKDRDAVTLVAEHVAKCVVLIQADCAEGYQLPSFGLCIFVSQSYSYTKWEQICGRFLRMDKPSRTTFLYLLTEGDSIDQAVYDAVKKKEDFKIELYARKTNSN
jgi:superfamily II DNA or RNA helicase